MCLLHRVLSGLWLFGPALFIPSSVRGPHVQEVIVQCKQPQLVLGFADLKDTSVPAKDLVGPAWES
jgi:hypothetical protein